MNQSPVISIVTVTYNADQLLERTLKSVFDQTYKAIEYIIVDGASTDKTMEIVARNRNRFATVISERDKGIYDAMNKGLNEATGEYLLFLNAGDELFDTSTLEKVFSSAQAADVYYGNTMIVDEKGNELGSRRLAPPENLNWKSLQFGMCVSHQSFIAKRSLAGEYNLDYRISADIDWTIRVLKQAKSSVHTGQFISRFLEGGTSAQRRKLGLKERWSIMVVHYGFIRTCFNHALILVRFVWHKISRKSMT
jgi:glycosyltransferase involved in cell wall biosynthesis